METWIIYVATAVVIAIIGTLIKERITDKKAKKALLFSVLYTIKNKLSL